MANIIIAMKISSGNYILMTGVSAEKSVHYLHVRDSQNGESDEENEQAITIIKVTINHKEKTCHDQKGQTGKQDCLRGDILPHVGHRRESGFLPNGLDGK